MHECVAQAGAGGQRHPAVGTGRHLGACVCVRAPAPAPDAAVRPSPTRAPPNLCREGVATRWSPAWQRLCPQADSQRLAAFGKKGPFSGGR